MQGLAQELAGPVPAQQSPTVEEIVALLMQGEDPERLVQMGIPPELIMQAIQLIEQQASSQVQAPAAPAQDPGLAQALGV